MIIKVIIQLPMPIFFLYLKIIHKLFKRRYKIRINPQY